MAAFNPDAYLASQPAFDPDAYLAGGQPATNAPQGYSLARAGKDFMTIPRGIVRGVQDITDTLVKGGASGLDALTGGSSRAGVDKTAKAMEAAYDAEYGDSLIAGGARIGGQVLGTLPVGPALGAGAKVLGAGAPVVNALATSGFSTGATAGKGLLPAATNMLTKMGAGAATGATASALTGGDPSLGGVIGGALPVAGAIATKAAPWAVKKFAGVGTGVGDEALTGAFAAGKKGGTEFLDNINGNVPMTDVLDSARASLSTMRESRSAAYKSGMLDISKDKTVLAFQPILDDFNALKNIGTYKGKVLNKSTTEVSENIGATLDDWAKSNPADFHTPEGFDALKKAIGDIRESTPFGTPARKLADTAYNSVKSQINAQAPTYANTMKGYEEASDLIKEIERAFSMGPKGKASADTAMRKLQSVTRNNVNTNFGNRLNLINTLEDAGGTDLMSSLAGQSLSSWMPRGIARYASLGGIAGVSVVNPMAAAALPFTSPKLMGLGAYGAGALSRQAAPVANKLIPLAYKTAPLLGGIERPQ